ncbi:MAG: hypothetical protein WBY98_19240, partial [Candidatus Sulfotelmatobacter sp.]
MSTLPQFVSRTENQSRWSQTTSLASPVLRTLLALSFAAVCLPRALGGVHPVPLDKNVDSAKCLECHEDKSKGKAVHSA